MQLREGMAICWVFQPVAGVAAVRKPGRIMELTSGQVRIRTFDEQAKQWTYPLVKPLTLRDIDERAAALLKQLESTFPFDEADAEFFGGPQGRNSSCIGNLEERISPLLKQGEEARSPARTEAETAGGVPAELKARGASESLVDELPVRVEVHVSEDDAWLVRAIARALADPQRAEAAREVLRPRFAGPLAALYERIERTERPATGRWHGHLPELDIRIAYRVIVMRDRCEAVAHALEVNLESVRRRVRCGVDLSLDRAADPALERFRYESMPYLRRRAPVLKPVLERAYLSVMEEKAKAATAPKKAAKRPRGRQPVLPPELDVQLAYRVVVEREQCEKLARMLGLTETRVRQRVRRGIVLVLDQAADPTLEPLRSEGLQQLRRKGFRLKGAFEKVLSSPALKEKLAATSTALRM
jgi:hypothetical protein